MNDFQFPYRLNSFLAWPVAIAGAFGICYAILRAILALLDSESYPDQSRSPLTEPNSGSSNYDLSILDRLSPFSRTIVQPIEVIDVAPDAPETSLDIYLYGVISNDSGGGSVILSISGQPQALYKIGDVIEGTDGAVLYSISENGAVINRQGQYERVSFTRDHDEGIVTVVPETYIPDSTPNYVITSLPVAEETVELNLPTNVTNKNAPTTNSLPRQPSTTQTSSLLNRMQIFELASSVRLDGNTEKNGHGLAVYPTRNARLFGQAGLQAGDVILQIDDVIISADADIVSLISQFENKTSVTLLIARGKAQIRHTVSLTD